MRDKLLVLDLDESLIHSCSVKLKSEEDFKIGQYYVYKRPDLDWFLAEVSKYFKIGIWSAAEPNYVEDIVERIIPKHLELELLWDKNWCTLINKTNGDFDFYNKDLTNLKKLGFELCDIILVDDSLKVVQANAENTIQIKPFKGDLLDAELKRIVASLAQDFGF